MPTSPVNRFTAIAWVASDFIDKGETKKGEPQVTFQCVIHEYLRRKKHQTWFWVNAFGWMVEKIRDRLKIVKGDQVYLEGRLSSFRNREDGSTRNTVILEFIMPMRRKRDSGWKDEEIDAEESPF